MSQGSFVLASLILLLRAGSATAGSSSVEPAKENAIEVIGVRREQTRQARAGQSVSIRPTEETRFDTRSHLRQEANLSAPETGRVNASGFSLPRVRGQDARFTEVYVDGLRIQDPYLGYPFVDDLDLRASGEMTIYVGNPPVTLPTVSPNGAIAYRILMPSKNQIDTGATVGRPFGTAVWALGGSKGDEQSGLRIYGREHWTDGRYEYYDDHATPYNSADDRLSERRHADRHSRQLLPTFVWQHGSHRIAGLGLWNEAATSLPSRVSDMGSAARERSTHRLGRLAYSYELQGNALIVPQRVGIEAAHYKDEVGAADPTGVVFGMATSSDRRLSSNSQAVEASWRHDLQEQPAQALLRAETGLTRIAARTGSRAGFDVDRQQSSLYAGLDLPLGELFRAEMKANIARQLDARESAEAARETLQVARARKTTWARGSSLGLALQPESTTYYAQLARLERPPTLLEEFGDGAMVRENPDLKPEHTEHRELGVMWRALRPVVGDRLGVRGAAFSDLTRERIVLLPSLAQTVRAQNHRRTEIRGLEMAGDVSLGASTLALGYARLWPRDLSAVQRERTIAGVAEHVAVGTFSHTMHEVTARWATRFQSQVWRDADNSIAVPAYTVHDLSFDGRRGVYALGFSVLNLTDQRRLPIRAPATSANQGHTSYSDYAGSPLPGRQWRLSLAASF